jgi:hypothetical protein
MRRPPSIAPALPDDMDVYLVLDDFGERLGRAWPLRAAGQLWICWSKISE